MITILYLKRAWITDGWSIHSVLRGIYKDSVGGCWKSPKFQLSFFQTVSLGAFWYVVVMVNSFEGLNPAPSKALIIGDANTNHLFDQLVSEYY